MKLLKRFFGVEGNSREEGCFLLLYIIAVAFIAYYYTSKDLVLRIAVSGWGPQDYVAHKLHPEHYLKDWPSSILEWDKSLPMQGYYYIAKYLSVSPTDQMYYYLFIQLLLFCGAVAFLAQTLFKNKLISLTAMLIVLHSNMAGLNLGRYGYGFRSVMDIPLTEAYAIPFGIFASVFFLKGRYVPCFLFMALAAYCHITMGLFFLAFSGLFLFCNYRSISGTSLRNGILLYLILIIPHVLYIILRSSIASGDMPIDIWIMSTRIFSYHWYPLTMKLFSANSKDEFFPFLVLCFFFVVALRYQNIKEEKHVKVLYGIASCLIISAIGIVFSDVFPIPFIVKLSPQRATGIITLFGVLYIIYYLIKKIETGSNATAAIAVYCLFTLAFSSPGIAVLPLFILIGLDVKEGYFGCFRIPAIAFSAIRLSYYALLIMILSVALISIVGRMITAEKLPFSFIGVLYKQLCLPLQFFDPFSGFDFLMRGGAFKIYPLFLKLIIASLLFGFGTALFRAIRNDTVQRAILNLCLFPLLFSVNWYLEYKMYENRYIESARLASDYLDVQLWAKAHTPPTSLFMPDPAHHYGWRDFSERSSFGSVHEWGFTSINLNPNYKTYLDGLKRMREFGIDLEKITYKDLRDSDILNYGTKIFQCIRSAYYAMTPDRLLDLCKKYRIDYFIMNKRYFERYQKIRMIERFDIAFENDSFVVFNSVGRQKPIEQTMHFDDGFKSWKGNNVIGMNELARISPPLVLLGNEGDFEFSGCKSTLLVDQYANDFQFEHSKSPPTNSRLLLFSVKEYGQLSPESNL